MSILETKDVTRDYRMGGEIVRALAGVSISVEKGEFVGILGTSGSGKSTLLNMLGGLDRPSTGEIIFNGGSLAPLSSWQMSRYRLHSVGMIFQSFNLIPTMTARQNVSLALAFAGMSQKERRAKAMDLLQRVGLSARSEHRPTELSGGEQQRVSIARALANEPEILLADEPTGNLDSGRAAELIGFLNEMRRHENKTIVMVTHDQELIRPYADRTIKLKDGRVVETAGA
ncbi:MAG TPA: ABC transporter ATP-binding protein [Blastocatellia bacterium]|nr:ABC transporter ATP-binding protein [Blastocatellia bacterium]